MRIVRALSRPLRITNKTPEKVHVHCPAAEKYKTAEKLENLRVRTYEELVVSERPEKNIYSGSLVCASRLSGGEHECNIIKAFCVISDSHFSLPL